MYVLIDTIQFLSYISLTARGFIDTTAGSDHYGKFSVSADEVRNGIICMMLFAVFHVSDAISFPAKAKSIFLR